MNTVLVNVPAHTPRPPRVADPIALGLVALWRGLQALCARASRHA